jgi:OmpA-OmpF porin, OOP family
MAMGTGWCKLIRLLHNSDLQDSFLTSFLNNWIIERGILMSIRKVSLGLVCLLAICTALSATPQAAGPDAKDCKDHPLFNRLADFHITKCESKDFDHYAFKSGKTAPIDVEGHYTFIWYKTNEGIKPPSRLAVVRNFQQATLKAGGTVVFTDDRYATLKFAKDGKEIWAQVDSAWNAGYQIFIIEKAGMAQEIVASAEAFSNDLKDTGHAAVYGIYFDSGQAVVKPESEPALEQIAKLLKGDPNLKVNVVGHTDNVGTIEANMKLSQARATAVAAALTSKYGIAAIKLKPYGVGPLSPVASNKTDDGKAKNRRVELVEQ